jgi:DNA-binding transcriptional LysR family regulator
MTNPLTIDHLRALKALDDFPNQAKAAKSLHITSAALNKRLSDVEMLVSQQLYDRHKHKLTIYGRKLLSTSLLDQLDTLYDNFKALEQLARNDVVIGVNSILSSLATPTVTSHMLTSPSIHIDYAQGRTSLNRVKWDKGLLDIWVDCEQIPEPRGDVEVRTFPFPEIAYWVHVSHPLAKTHQRPDADGNGVIYCTLAEALQYPLISPTGVPEFWEEHFRSWLSGLGYPFPEGYRYTSPFHHIMTNSHFLLTDALMKGAIGGGIKHTMGIPSQQPDLIEVIVEDEPEIVTSDIFVAWNPRTEFVQTLAESILEDVKRA